MPVNNPRLFGIVNSNRDFKDPDTWGKNRFNSSFPAALVAYLYSKGLDCVYIKTDSNNLTYQDKISAENLFGISPLDDIHFMRLKVFMSNISHFL